MKQQTLSPQPWTSWVDDGPILLTSICTHVHFSTIIAQKSFYNTKPSHSNIYVRSSTSYFEIDHRSEGYSSYLPNCHLMLLPQTPNGHMELEAFSPSQPWASWVGDALILLIIGWMCTETQVSSIKREQDFTTLNRFKPIYV